MPETVIYRKGNILISSARVTIGAATYQLANIVSVHTRYVFPFANIGVACILASAYFVYRAIEHHAHSASFVRLSYIELAAGIGLLASGVWLRFFLRRFTLVFNSQGRDIKALSTYSAGLADELAYAVKKAIVTRA